MVNLVERVSCGERLDTDLGDRDTDRNPNGITICHSMMVYEDQHRETGRRLEIHLACLVTACAHNRLIREQEKLSFHMVVRVEQQDLETSLRRVWHIRKIPSERGEGRSIADL